MVTNEERYLNLIGIQQRPPSVSYLTSLIHHHLSKIPYENISKIIRYYEIGPSIPTLEEFVEGVA